MIKIKSLHEIEKMRAAGRIVAETFEVLKPHIVPGITTMELDKIAAEHIKKSGAGCSFYNYGGFQIKTYPDNSKDFIDTVTIKNDSVSTPEGITIGSSRDEVIAAYGEDYEEKGDGLIYKNGKTTLNIVVRGGAVTSIYYDYDFE